MASIAIFTSRQGKKRYRVHCLINGTTRRKDYRTLEEACHQLYLTEAHKLKACTPVEFLALRDFTVQKVLYFYLGYQWAKVRNGELAEGTFRQCASDFAQVGEGLRATRVGKISALLMEDGVPVRCRRQVRAAFNLLKTEFKLLINNPCPKPVRKERKPPVIPSSGDVKRLYEATDDPCIRMFIFLCATCGLRTSEALALRRDDLSERKLTIRRHLTQQGITPGLKRGDWREVKVNNDFFLLNARLDPEAEFFISGSRRDKPVNLQSFRSKKMRPLYQSLGFRFSNHALRHFAAANWIAEGRDLMTVKKLLGHKDIGTTLTYYGHLIGEPEEVKSHFQI